MDNVGVATRTDGTLDRPDWDSWFITLCFVIAQRSLDKDTKHGAILCNNEHQILGVGYNGFPRGGNDCSLPMSRPLKYEYMVHAESNCILNSQNLMIHRDSTMYITGMPCSGCMLQMIQVGVKNVVYGPVTSTCVNYDIIQTVRHLSNEYKVHMRYCGGSGGSSLIKNMIEKYNYFIGAQENPLDKIIVEKLGKM